MSTDENESASIVEALRRLPDPIVFAHPKYAVAAVSSGASRCARSGTNKESRGPRTSRIEHTGNTDATRTAVDGVGDEAAISELLFQQMLRHWKSEHYRSSSTTTIGGGGGIKKQQNRIVQLLVTAAVPLPSTLPVVVEIVRCFMRYSGAASRPEGTLSRCIHNALDLLLQWASPSMGFTLTVRSTGTALTAGVDVLYSTPVLLSPWMDNAVLVAMACAPEWSVRELCGSYRIAAWVHTHITASRLSNITPAQRLSRWNWLDKCLRALISAADMAILVRTLCALLIAVEVELIPQADTVFPRSASRDKEGLLLLLTILAQRGGGGGRGSVCIAAGNDESDDNSESCDDFDSSLPEDADSFIAAFLAEQTTSVDFALAPSHGVPMRRLRGVVDELYRFVAEWLRCAVSGALRGAAVPLREQSQRPDDLPGVSLLVGQIDHSDNSPHCGAAFPLSLLPVHLFSDVLQDRQLRCAVGKGFHRAAGLSAIDSSARTPFSVAPPPLWPAAKKSPGPPAWLAEVMIAGAVRSADMSPAQWRVRAGGLLPAALCPTGQRARHCARVDESPTGPVLCARHALREARYGLSAWEGFPALMGPATPPQERARSGRGLSMFVDPIVLQRSGAPVRRPLSPEESAHAAQLRVCYAHLLRRAAAAVDVGGRVAMGLHLVPPLGARQALLRHAVGLSLVWKLLPSPPAVGCGATHSLADFCERYSALLKDSAVIRDMRRRYDAHGLTDAEFVERICLALRLPQNGFRVVGDVIHLTEETVACLAQRAAAAVEVEVEGDGLMDTTDYDEEDGITTVVSSATPRGAQRLHRANRKEPEKTEQKEEPTFHVFELQTARDARPLDFEEWCNMIDTMLAPPTQTVNCSDTVLSF